MKFNFKNYQFYKTKQYLIKNNFFFFAIGVNQDSRNWVNTEQGLNKLSLNYYKTYNNITAKLIKKSTYKNSINLVKSTFFFIKPKSFYKHLIKRKLFQGLNSTFFTLLSIKINNKIYSRSQSKSINSLNYKDNIELLYQFLLTNLKFSCSLTKTKKQKISKQCDSNT